MVDTNIEQCQYNKDNWESWYKSQISFGFVNEHDRQK